MKYILIIFFSFYFLTSLAQVSIQGVVKNKETNKAIPAAVVTLSSESDIVAYDITNDNGEFSIKTESVKKQLTINVSLLGYIPYTSPVRSKTEKIQIYLQPSEIQLKEVKVKANSIWQKEDTLVYSVSAFQTTQDRKIGDILRKLPGIQVSENGGIQYNGVPINKFYIDGSDLLERKYGIATNNIPVDAIPNIEVIQNHQPIKVLKDVTISDQAAINLKVKDNRMSRPIGEAKLGAGSSDNDFLHQVDAFAMQVQKKSQMLVMYKTNNTGTDIASELTNHTLQISDDNIREPLKSSILNGTGVGSPPLERQRYLFNNTHLLTINNLWKINEDKQLRVNVNYLNNKTEQNLYQNSTYFLSDSSIFISESEKFSKRSNLLDGILTYTQNSKESYTNNQTKVSIEWNKTLSDIHAATGIKEHYKTPLYYLHNDLNINKKIGEHIFNISSYVQYSSLPHNLDVKIDTVDNILRQEIRHNGFYTQNSSSASFLFGRSSFKIKLSMEASFENLKSDLEYYNSFSKDSLKNNINFDYVKTLIIPKYTFQSKKNKLNIDLPIDLQWLKVDNKNHNITQNYSILYLNPQLRYRYIINSFWETNLYYRYTHNIGDITDFTNSYIMTNYRTLNRKSGILAKRNNQSISMRINYKNPISTLFAHTQIYYRTSKTNTLNQQDFSAIQSSISDIEHTNTSYMWLLNNYVGKYVDLIKTNFSLSISYNKMKTKKTQQSVLYPINSIIWNINPKINTKINDHITIEYKADFVKDNLSIENNFNSVKTSVYRLNQKLSGFYFVNNKIEISTHLEYLNNKITKDITSSIFFTDLGFKYKHRQLEYSLSCNNLFNKKDYSYTIYNTMNTYSYIYNIRPLNILGSLTFKF